jgi:hypothetical protein
MGRQSAAFYQVDDRLLRDSKFGLFQDIDEIAECVFLLWLDVGCASADVRY